jgi:hypothetical protein
MCMVGMHRVHFLGDFIGYHAFMQQAEALFVVGTCPADTLRAVQQQLGSCQPLQRQV